MCTATASSRIVLPAQLNAGRLSRRFVDEHWCTLHDDLARDDAARDRVHLLVTELVTNAVRHGKPPITLTLRCFRGAEALIAVSDGSSSAPVRQHVDPHAPGARGVALVEQLSNAWGIRLVGAGEPEVDVEHDGELIGQAAQAGKTVWCRVLA